MCKHSVQGICTLQTDDNFMYVCCPEIRTLCENEESGDNMSIDKKSSYYDAGGIETIEVIKAKLTSEQYKGYLLGNITKYSCRMNHKGSFARDTEKVVVYYKQLQEIRE